MPENVIFKDLPASFPEKDKYRKLSVVGSIIVHGFLIVGLIVVPLLIPHTLSDRELLITLVSPIPPPEGTVSEIRVISGHPLLVQAAIDCVKKWQYEPTLLNGVPVPVILTAKVTFSQAPVS